VIAERTVRFPGMVATATTLRWLGRRRCGPNGGGGAGWHGGGQGGGGGEEGAGNFDCLTASKLKSSD
jgi:hypothetical protein